MKRTEGRDPGEGRPPFRLIRNVVTGEELEQLWHEGCRAWMVVPRDRTTAHRTAREQYIRDVREWRERDREVNGWIRVPVAEVGE